MSLKGTVQATTSAPTTAAEKDVLLQRLLADRFALRTHFETQPQAAYALVVSRADRRLGPNLKLSDFDCAAHDAARGAPDGVPKAPDGLPICYSRVRQVGDGLMQMRIGGVNMPEFAAALTSLLQRVVVDRTGLSAPFDIDITYARQQDLLRVDASVDGVSLFRALTEQLGLKLEPRTETVEVLVIDNVERPTPN